MNAMTPIQTRILELWRQELTTPQIGERLGMEERNVAYQIKQLRAHGVALPSRARVTRGEAWTPERVEKLKVLHAEGQSANAIARALGGGLSRCAVISKVHRLGLQRPKETDRRPGRPRCERKPSAPRLWAGPHQASSEADMAVILPLPLPAHAPNGERMVSLMMLSSKTCRWPIGEPGTKGFGFCGMSPRESTPYCEYHARLAYQPLYSRARRHTA